jgi:hypothetical protein
MRRRTWLLGAAALPLSACVVAPHGLYFRPSTDAPATVRRPFCGHQSGPPSQIVLDAGTIAIEAEARRDYIFGDGSHIPLKVRLLLPRQRPVRFTADRLRVIEQASQREIDAPASVRVLSSATLAATDEVDIAVLHPAGAVPSLAISPAPYGLATLRLHGPERLAPLAMQVQAPALWLAGQRHMLPPVVVRRPPGSTYVNYRDSATTLLLEQRAESCRSDKTARDCIERQRLSETSFQGQAGGMQWRGQLRFTTETAERPLHGRLELTPGDARPWRLESDTVEVRDIGGGPPIPLHSRELDIEFRDELPLSAPLHRRRSPASGDTRIDITLRLPNETPNFELRFPPAWVGEERVDIPALRFERRALDGGVEPFNC